MMADRTAHPLATLQLWRKQAYGSREPWIIRMYDGMAEMIHRLERAASETPAVLDTTKTLYAALGDLVKLKDYKDQHGKSGAYEYAMPRAWAHAKEILTAARRSEKAAVFPCQCGRFNEAEEFVQIEASDKSLHYPDVPCTTEKTSERPAE